MKTTNINNNWKIVHENDCSTLIFFEPRISNKGTDKEKNIIFEQPYYYPNLESALIGYTLKSLDNSKDIQDVLRVIEETKQEIKNVCK
jgi:hypothetical protein